VGVALVGYYVGSRIPDVDRYILIAIGLAVLSSLVPTIIQLVRLHLRRRKRSNSSD
jgi:membrane-associated protein